ncbi:MAG: hypothetical protein NW224_14620 [Leptolyngbyaceae cyanobacterium bins.302]|nr:hypothetical protein [Leptolyngbyaceae cyanobacterium bins.302]
MKQEVILDFLNLPGIAGVALMDRRSRPCFCGIDQTLNFQQKEALTQGILQVFETIPDEFESFEFHFGGHQVYIYKLDRGIILLVLTQGNLVYSDYLKTIKNLKATIREDIPNAIATFRLIASTVNLPGITTTRRTSTQRTQRTEITPSSKEIPAPNSVPPANQVPVINTAPAPPSPKPPLDTSTNGSTPAVSPAKAANLNEAIVALNTLSQFTTQYLGTHVIANYWKATRPQQEWISQFQVDRTAQISLMNATPQQLQTLLTPDQQAWLQEWVANFIKRCSQVIRDFPTLIQQKALTDEQKKLLWG